MHRGCLASLECWDFWVMEFYMEHHIRASMQAYIWRVFNLEIFMRALHRLHCSTP